MSFLLSLIDNLYLYLHRGHINLILGSTWIWPLLQPTMLVTMNPTMDLNMDLFRYHLEQHDRDNLIHEPRQPNGPHHRPIPQAQSSLKNFVDQ